MRKFLAIVGREWRAYFLSPLAWVILAAFLLLNGYVFTVILAVLNEPGAAKDQALLYLFANGFSSWFTLFIVPVIAMRLFPEERRSGTIEVLLTSPVTEAEVVLGKFTGALGFYLTLWAPSLIYVWILRTHAGIDLGPVASAYLGIALLGGYFVSVGTFASTLTKNQIVAAILTFALLVPIFSAGLLDYLIRNPKIRESLNYLNMWVHLEEFAKGIVDTRRVIYYLSATAFFLFLATASLAAKKETP
jgi:gliding motility-associated transport system permease protein